MIFSSLSKATNNILRPPLLFTRNPCILISILYDRIIILLIDPSFSLFLYILLVSCRCGYVVVLVGCSFTFTSVWVEMKDGGGMQTKQVARVEQRSFVIAKQVNGIVERFMEFLCQLFLRDFKKIPFSCCFAMLSYFVDE